MNTTNHIIIATLIALLVPATASANVYEDRLKEAFDDIINAVPLEDLSQMHTTYTDPETGVKEGQLDVYKFTIGSENMGLINNAKRVYEQVNGNSTADIYTLWWNDNDGGTFQGYRLYYSPENAITVGTGCDHCYTVGFLTPNDKQHRTTYTIEWDDDYLYMYYDLEGYKNGQKNRARYLTIPIKYAEDNMAPGHYFQKPFYFLFNLAVGGTFTNIYDPSKITALPNAGDEAKMYIDWVGGQPRLLWRKSSSKKHIPHWAI